MSDHFVMVWGDMLRSTINEHEAHVKWAFVVMLLLCDKDGDFRSTPQYLSREAVIPLDQAIDAFEKLSEPDPGSSSKEEEGRRIISTGPNQWHVVNYTSYRQRMLYEKRRAADVQRKRDERGQVRTDVDGCGQVGTGDDAVDVGVGVVVDVDVPPKKKGGMGGRSRKSEIPFEEFWEPLIRKEGKKKAESAWRNLTVKDQKAAMAVLPDHLVVWSGKETQFIPHPATWINQRRWEDELEEKGADPQKVGLAPTNGEWVYETYRKEVRDNHGNHSMWESYAEEASDLPPKTARPFLEWLDGLGG